MPIEFMQQPHSAETTKNSMHPLFKEWFFSKFSDFSEPQRYSIFNIHSRINTLVSAPTGSGKTLSAFGAVLNELIDNREKGILQNKVYCVYISPLKALSNDIQKNLVEPLQEMELIAKEKYNMDKLGIRVGLRTGDTSASERQKMALHPPHILITTPESLAIMLTSPKFSAHLKDVDWCVVDEVHALAENKRGVHLSLILELLSHDAKHMTRVGLSATVAPLEHVAQYLVGSDGDCKVVDVQYIKQLDLQVVSPVKDLISSTHEIKHTAMYKLVDELIQQHKTTLIFTNTRSATERVVDHLKHKFPSKYTDNIGAHHSSLGKNMRFQIEDRLRKGELKVVVCSTSLELGIDIGYIDLVICLGSPKSVARCLQRIGRSGHKLHEKAKGRIIVLDRDDLVECAVLVKAALEKKIDRLHIPQNCLDVLAQQLIGMATITTWSEDILFKLVKKSYCYRDLKREDFNDVLAFLAGEYSQLEDRHVYARIWRKDGMIGRRGKLARVLYMTNVGTIPEESFVTVKIGSETIGYIDEGFLEKLKPGDVFILGGNTYLFKFARGMVAQVAATSNRPPTVPSWFSEMLPLSFDLSMEIGRFRRLLEEKFQKKHTKEDILTFLHTYLYIDDNGAEAVYSYFALQYAFCQHMPTDRKILIEHYTHEKETKIIFHTLYGRRVNDVLSRAVGYVVGKTQHKDIEIGISDNGFYLAAKKNVQAKLAFTTLKSTRLHELMEVALDSSEVLKRRFRHCATRALMILRNYMGRQKGVGRQQVSSMLLISAVKRLSTKFSILREARREVLEDLMDIDHAAEVLKAVENGKVQLQEIHTTLPSPFAFGLAFQGYMDVLKIEDRTEFLKRMHEMVVAKASLDSGKLSKEKSEKFDYKTFWKNIEEQRLEEQQTADVHLRTMVWELEHLPAYAKMELARLLQGEKNIRKDVLDSLETYKDKIKKTWPAALQKAIAEKVAELEK